ncbi:MAG TPA: class I SAM-dependent methyltransferase [Gemmatimonadaceae bacterium]|nr:class I SAM-dependent methyltransferase [Gemmatimonadaceae bacterium]
MREQCAREMRRVLKPGGKALVVEFSRNGKTLIERLHRGHALELGGIHDVLRSAGFDIVESGMVRTQGLNFTFAKSQGSPAL